MLNAISIVGATSRLGITLVRKLREHGFPVLASYRELKNIPACWKNDDRVTFHKIDFDSPCDMQKIYKRTVVWLTHIRGTRSSDEEISLNAYHFERFLELAPLYGVRKIVFVSSGGTVYGEPSCVPIHEDHARNPFSSYGKAKKKLEDLLISYSGLSNVAIIRPGNIYEYDPFPDRGFGVIRSFNGSIIHKTPFNLLGEGHTIRDFIHIDDVSSAIIYAINSLMPFIVWNVGTGVGTRIIDILDVIVEKTGFEQPVFVHRNNPISDVKENILAIDRIKKESSWVPTINIDDGIEQIASNIKRLINDTH